MFKCFFITIFQEESKSYWNEINQKESKREGERERRVSLQSFQKEKKKKRNLTGY